MPRKLSVQALEQRQLLAADLLSTQLVRDINTQTPASHARDFVKSGDQLFFVADDGVHGRELFVINDESGDQGVW